ncbi:hypothetical protein BOX15_Mlig028152g2 [Macrostomum lignano]|uniref:Uncharacterized protein n=1 Tax=Macrostomum lignano TaxID=282301 RepID=A0A267GEZ6_9PLAT|nr:hypothetical protein BOX15_Mlig028152g2 [Macrostomum lignano]
MAPWSGFIDRVSRRLLATQVVRLMLRYQFGTALLGGLFCGAGLEFFMNVWSPRNITFYKIFKRKQIERQLQLEEAAESPERQRLYEQLRAEIRQELIASAVSRDKT